MVISFYALDEGEEGRAYNGAAGFDASIFWLFEEQ